MLGNRISSPHKGRPDGFGLSLLKENIWRGLNIVISDDADESMVGVLCFCHIIYLLIFFWDRMWMRTYLL